MEDIINHGSKGKNYLKSKNVESEYSHFECLKNKHCSLPIEIGIKTLEFLSRFIDYNNPNHVLLNSYNIQDVDGLIKGDVNLIFSVKPINNLRSINEFFQAANFKIVQDGIFICRFIPQKVIEERILNKYCFPINKIAFFFYYLFKRVMPKLSLTRNLYFFISKAKNRSLSKLEMIGRLYASGFVLLDEFSDGDCMFLVAKKKRAPIFDQYSSYGLLFKMRRVGMGGKEIFVYKLRTMVPFSEYLQEEFLIKNKLTKGGKISNDIRITPLGRILRKFWIDEIPNIINLIKGEMKLVGVRPISKQYFNLYAPELQELRLKVKPGMIPPFYVDLPETLEEIQQSEKKYIESYLKKPYRTDLTYFFVACKNILLKNVRSK